jgi:hypothetical protein
MRLIAPSEGDNEALDALDNLVIHEFVWLKAVLTVIIMIGEYASKGLLLDLVIDEKPRALTRLAREASVSKPTAARAMTSNWEAIAARNGLEH